MKVEIDGIEYLPKQASEEARLIKTDDYRNKIIEIWYDQKNPFQYTVIILLDNGYGTADIDADSISEGMKLAKSFINGFLHNPIDYTKRNSK